MMPDEFVGRTNETQVGEYTPETLLVSGPDTVEVRAAGWNTADHDGRPVRIADRAGKPLFQSAPITVAHLAGVRFYPERKSP